MSDFQDIKLIVADMDGTLLDDEKRLDSGILAILPQLAEKGIRFTLASGRNIHIMRSYLEELSLTLPCITNNGANIFQDQECIYEKNMEVKELDFAFSLLQEEGIPFITYASDAVYTQNLQEARLQFFLNRLRGKTQLEEVSSYAQILRHSIFKVVMVNEEEVQMRHVMERINQRCQHLHCVRSEDNIYTITHVDATKGKTLEHLLQLLDVTREQTMVFGDNFNDATMFTVAGICVAMENGQEEVKAQADYIAPDNNHQGVSRFIKEHLL